MLPYGKTHNWIISFVLLFSVLAYDGGYMPSEAQASNNVEWVFQERASNRMATYQFALAVLAINLSLGAVFFGFSRKQHQRFINSQIKTKIKYLNERNMSKSFRLNLRMLKIQLLHLNRKDVKHQFTLL